jgi:predicted RNA-binding Zn-ribbon protein involved in translation (DUF1610 family)
MGFHRPFCLCAQHGRWLTGERPIWRLIAPTISGRQGRHREVGSGGSRKQTCDLRNTKANQKIGQWPHGQFVKYLTYKAARYGMRVEQIPEDYSTRTCSHCGCVMKNAPRRRVYACPGCGAVIHRDVNGASNICSRARYGEYSRVQAQTIMYLRPLGRSRAFDTGRSCLR